MILPILLSLFLALSTALASPLQLRTTDDADCFASVPATCRQSGRTLFADTPTALSAIEKACAQIPSCTPGTAPKPDTVTGSVPSFTATLHVGAQCAGLRAWTPDACVALFKTSLFPRCKTSAELPYPEFPPVPWPPVEPVTFPLASVVGKCDGSALGFNIAG